MGTMEKPMWYYDKTHYLIKSVRNLCKYYLQISTEQLSNENTIYKITKFIDNAWEPVEGPVRVNVSKIDYKVLSREDRVIISRFYNQFDYIKAAKNPLLGEKYFHQKIIDGYIYRKQYEHTTISCSELSEYLHGLEQRILEIKDLMEKEKACK